MGIRSLKRSTYSRSLLVGNPMKSPIAGYKAWYDASDTSTISLSGTSVTQWNDKSGNGYHLKQATLSRCPDSGTRKINNRNVLDYTPYNRTLTASDSSASDWVFLHNGESTVFTVLMFDGFQSAEVGIFGPYTRGGSIGDGPGVTNQLTSSNKVWHQIIGASSAIVASNTTVSTVDVNKPTILTFVGDPGNASATERSAIYINSGPAEKNSTSTSSKSSNNPPQVIRVGDYTGGGTLSIDGAIAEIVIYDSKLSDAQISKNISYLKTKWGI